jgi:hypothetical protein
MKDHPGKEYFRRYMRKKTFFLNYENISRKNFGIEKLMKQSLQKINALKFLKFLEKKFVV